MPDPSNMLVDLHKYAYDWHFSLHLRLAGYSCVVKGIAANWAWATWTMMMIWEKLQGPNHLLSQISTLRSDPIQAFFTAPKLFTNVQIGTGPTCIWRCKFVSPEQKQKATVKLRWQWINISASNLFCFKGVPWCIHESLNIVPSVIECSAMDKMSRRIYEDCHDQADFICLQCQVVQIAAGGMHSVVLTEDRNVFTTGVNDEAALGRKTGKDLTEATFSNDGTHTYRFLDYMLSGLSRKITSDQLLLHAFHCIVL